MVSFWLPYLLGLVTLPALAGLFYFAVWALSKDWGYGPCDHCTHLGGEHGYDIGTRTNIMHWLDSTLHAQIWARTKRHRIARGNVWRENDAKGYKNTNRWYPKYML